MNEVAAVKKTRAPRTPRTLATEDYIDLIKKAIVRFNSEIIEFSTKKTKLVPEIRTKYDETTGIFQLVCGRITAVYNAENDTVPPKMEAAMSTPESEICVQPSDEINS